MGCRPLGTVPEPEGHILVKTDSDAAGKEADKQRAKVEKAKSKGRFQIIESDDQKARAPKVILPITCLDS